MKLTMAFVGILMMCSSAMAQTSPWAVFHEKIGTLIIDSHINPQSSQCLITFDGQRLTIASLPGTPNTPSSIGHRRNLDIRTLVETQSPGVYKTSNDGKKSPENRFCGNEGMARFAEYLNVTDQSLILTRLYTCLPGTNFQDVLECQFAQ